MSSGGETRWLLKPISIILILAGALLLVQPPYSTDYGVHRVDSPEWIGAGLLIGSVLLGMIGRSSWSSLLIELFRTLVLIAVLFVSIWGLSI